jgi:serine/threonine protein kinase
MTNAASSSEPGDRRDDLSERYWRLWENGQQPDLDAFLATCTSLAPAQLAAVIRIDQRERWRAGERVPIEEYLRRFPPLADNAEIALDLIYNEFLLRERAGDEPAAQDFMDRFPRHADILRDQIDLHRALGTPASAGATLGPPVITAPTRVGGATLGDLPPPRPEERGAVRMLPEVFGRYRITRLLGQGGMGAVYLARDTHLEREVALKVPRLGEDADTMTIARFYREARVAATFVHPQLCPVYEVGQIDGIHYLTMPYLKGELLSERLRRETPLPPAVAVRFCVTIARALHDAHQAGVLHRDLKPSNIMLNARQEPIVMDFGLARRGAARDPRMSTSGMILGTPVYCSPEQIGGDPETLGPECDIYSLGVILYEMVTGQPPFRGAAHEVLRQVLVDVPSPPSRLRPELDPRLEAVCLRALAKQPKERFANMEEFATALEDCLGDDDATLTPHPARNLPKSPPRRAAWSVTGRRLLLGAALLLVPLGGWSVWYIAHHRAPARLEPPDLFHAGARWAGAFRFRPPHPPMPSDVVVLVTRRDGNRFWGEYATEQQTYRWEIAGETRDAAVSWTLTRFLGDVDPVSGAASVAGTYTGRTLNAVFKDDDSEAEITLQKMD